MFKSEEGKKIVKYAREVIESILNNQKINKTNFENFFDEKLGVFVTIHTYPSHNLRGCIGIPRPIMSLKNSISEASKSVIKDPRFPPLIKDELNKIIIEVTILTNPEKIIVSKPEDYIKEINIGKDGLIIEKGFNSGLLLPQVPIEQGWNIKEYLSNICLKAGLYPDSWMNSDVILYKFSGQIFTEVNPNGDIKEKSLNGFDN